MSKGSGSTRSSNSSNPRRVSSPVTRLSGDVPAGIIVKFAEVIDPGDEAFRGIVLEDRGSNLLVKDAESSWTRVLQKNEMVKDGVSKDDDAKIQRLAVGEQDYQRVALSNGQEIEVRNSSSRGSGRITAGVVRGNKVRDIDVSIDYGPGTGITYTNALNRVRDYLRRESRK